MNDIKLIEVDKILALEILKKLSNDTIIYFSRNENGPPIYGFVNEAIKHISYFNTNPYIYFKYMEEYEFLDDDYSLATKFKKYLDRLVATTGMVYFPSTYRYLNSFPHFIIDNNEWRIYSFNQGWWMALRGFTITQILEQIEKWKSIKLP